MASRRSRLAEALIIIALITFSAVLLLSLNLLATPFGALSSVGSTVTQVNEEHGKLTVVLGVVNYTIPGSPFKHELPASGVGVVVYIQGTPRVENDSETNSSGVDLISLPPTSYTVRIADQRFNLSVDVQIIANETTTLHAVLNETNYPASAFDLVDSDSANYVGGWNEVFARIQTNQTIPTGSGITTYVRFFVNYFISDNNVPASIVSASQGSGSQWLQLKLGQFFSVEGVNNLEIITHSVSYAVNTSAS